MVIKKEKLHVICWVCGSRDDFIIRNKDQIFITCNNCSTLTDLEEEITKQD